VTEPIAGIHPAAAAGFSAAADAYERGRPTYPPDAVAYLVDVLRMTTAVTAVDVGAGTGKLTRLLEPTGARLVAVEPVPAMARALAERVPRVLLVAGRAEAMPLRDASVDAIVAAQAFHWFDGPAALEEFARVLRPRGRVAIVFNRRDESDALMRGLGEVFEPYRAGVPTHRSERWQAAFDANAAFHGRRRRSFDFVHEQTAEAVVDRITSISFIAALPDDERRNVAADVRRVVGERAADPGRVRMRYRTDVFSAELA
jgi:SAM-dependent methyltransferase